MITESHHVWRIISQQPLEHKDDEVPKSVSRRTVKKINPVLSQIKPQVILPSQYYMSCKTDSLNLTISNDPMESAPDK
jgi:hypothetical protein